MRERASAKRFGILVCAAAVAIAAHADWEVRSDGLTSLFIVGITIDPSDGDRVFATTRGQGTWRSLDGGASWEKTSTGLPSDWGPPYGHLLNDGVVISFADSDRLWTAAALSMTSSTYGRIYRSTDGGDSWQLKSNGASAGGWYGIAGIAQDPTDADHLYAGTIVSGADGGLFESVDGGDSWENIAGSLIDGDGALANDAWPIRIDPTNPQRLYSGSPHDAMLYSRDGGRTWTESNPAGVGADTSVYEISLAPTNPDRLWIGHSDGTYRSDDAGLAWTDRSSEFGGERITAMRFAPSDPDIGYALAGRSVYATDDGGASWHEIADENFYGRCLAVNPNDPRTVLMGTWGRGVLRSTDGGASWSEQSAGMPTTALIDVDFVRGDPTGADRAWCHLRGNGLYRSDDRGAHWTFVHGLSSFYMDSFWINPADTDRMLYTWYDLFRSTDGGARWETVLEATDGARYRGLSYDPVRDRVWVVDSRYDDPGSRVLYSRDDGARWVPKTAPGNPPLDQYSAIAIDPSDPDVILVAGAPKWSSMMNYGWIFRSEDGGNTWQRIRDGLELRDWNILTGQWIVDNDRLVQSNLNGDQQAGFRGFAGHDADYEMRTRITASDADNPQHWVGLSTCRPSVGDGWRDGVMAAMRRNGDVFLWAGGESRVYASNAVANASSYQRLGVRVRGDTYTLLLNDAEMGAWTDPSAGYGDGYACLACYRTRAEFDDFEVTGTPGAVDRFDIGNWGNGYNLRDVVFSPTQPGVAYCMGSGEGVYRSRDHGLSWERMTSSADEKKYFYHLSVSRHGAGNVLVTVGAFGSTPRFETRIYSPDGLRYEVIGSAATHSYRSPIGEDAVDPDLLYGAQYGPGVEVFTGEPVPRPGVIGDMINLR